MIGAYAYAAMWRVHVAVILSSLLRITEARHTGEFKVRVAYGSGQEPILVDLRFSLTCRYCSIFE